MAFSATDDIGPYASLKQRDASARRALLDVRSDHLDLDPGAATSRRPETLGRNGRLMADPGPDVSLQRRFLDEADGLARGLAMLSAVPLEEAWTRW